MKLFKHGNPGIGVTAQPGKKGMSGNSVYFGTLDSFFEFIGDNVLTDSSIDYDDSDYDITYTLDELRLSHLYNVGDILYVLSDNTSTASVLYMAEISEDMTLCTKDYFLSKVKYDTPFTTNKHIYPLNIVSNNALPLFNANDLYNDGLVKVTNVGSGITIDVNKVENLYITSETLNFIPLKHGDLNNTVYINNGRDILLYSVTKNDTLSTLLYMKAGNNGDCNIVTDSSNGVTLKTSTNNICIDNLYIRTTNLGNVEASNNTNYYTLNIDTDCNCYTLSEKDYDSSACMFIIDTSSFFNVRDFDINDYTYGYIHMYWNYNDLNYVSTTNTSMYRSNYIRSTQTETELSTIRIIKTDLFGSFVRDYENPKYKNISSIYIKLLLINTLDTSTLNDVSNLLNESVSDEDVSRYKDVHGIITTEYVNKYLTYNYILDLFNNNTVTYKHYINGYKEDVLTYNESIVDVKDLWKYLDTSFYSGVDYKTNPDNKNILLYITDDLGNVYRHHNILTWIIAPTGVKYFSKLTEAHYNYQTNSFDIKTKWETSKTNSTYIADDIFNYTFNGNVLDVYINPDYNITNIQLIENNKNVYNNEKTSHIQVLLKNDDVNILESLLSNVNILNQLYNNELLDILPNTNLYVINYELNGKKNTYQFKHNINGYTEYRTLPIVNLHMYNDMKSLELLNDVNRGILCNQFLTFVDLSIDEFSNENWGKLLTQLKNPRLKIKLNVSVNTIELNDNKTYTVKYDLLKPNVDIFNATSRDLCTATNIKYPVSDYYMFTIDEALSGIYHLRILIESKNPVPFLLNANVYVEELSVETDKYSYKLDLTNGHVSNEINVLYKNRILYGTDILKVAVAPISYITGYNLDTSKIKNINTNIWYGSSDKLNITVAPYMLEKIESKYNSYSTSRNADWNAIKFKYRYLQDNISLIKINTINVNNIYLTIPDNMYYGSYLAADRDDIFETYLQLVYNSDLLNPKNINDEYKFIYNNKEYLASEYGLLANNTAIYIKQNTDIQVRDGILMKSLKTWNNLYEQSYRYESDNPYLGINETYGNGYLYLPKAADTGLYLTLNNMSLKDIKTIGNKAFLTSTDYVTDVVNKPDKNDEYTPSILFRSLLYGLSWNYPKYTTIDNINVIEQLPFGYGTTITNTTIREDEMPYNLCYSIYPRIMFNDEEQYNIVLMLRRPSVTNENQYELLPSLVCMNIDDNTIIQLQNPINVMN